ncbi:MAG TPA: CYTH and CHAD domain-containing protein [Streptosporangiaceae bacterium]|nr:CYTH and CHAD domain-containing protein [Streptosporangiaceae bacterium]
MTDVVEIERKYDVDHDFVVPDLSGLPGCSSVGRPETHLLVANYFDTDDLRLAARGITLRRRRGGDDAGWHLKIPVGPDAKNELRAPLGKAQNAPARLTALVTAYTRGQKLRPVARLETRRTVTKLYGESGEVLAEVADDQVSGQRLHQVVDDTTVTAWREIEVELGAAGSARLLAAVGKRLRKAGARRAASASKLGRVLKVPTDAARPRAAWTTAGDVAVGYLAEQVDAVLAYDPKVRLQEYDAVHKMRVAVRRTRSILKSYGAVLDRGRTEPLQPELKWLADALGEVRDLEVLRERFTGRLADLAAGGSHPWLDALADEEQAAYRRLFVTLKEPRYFALLDALEGLVADPPLTERARRPIDKEVPRLVVRSWHRLARAYESIEAAEDHDAARHETRKAAKRARYTAEAAARALGKPAANVAAQAESLQEVLGRFQDGVIAQQHLAGTAETVTDPRESFTLGALSGVEHCAAVAALDEVDAVWRRASDPKHLRKLRGRAG